MLILKISPHLKRVATLPCETVGSFLNNSGQLPIIFRHPMLAKDGMKPAKFL